MFSDAKETTTATHLHASGGTYVDTETVLTLNTGGRSVSVVVTMLPGLQWWDCPDAATMRGWVDDLLKDTPLHRFGKRYEVTAGSSRKWYFTYPTK